MSVYLVFVCPEVVNHNSVSSEALSFAFHSLSFAFHSLSPFITDYHLFSIKRKIELTAMVHSILDSLFVTSLLSS